MEDMLKIAAVAVISAICAVVLKKNVRELGLVLSLLAGTLILGFALLSAEPLGGVLERLTALAGLSPGVLTPVVKTVGISVLTHVSAEICRDAGEGGIAAFTETAGAAAALLAAVPLLETVLALMGSLL